MPVNKGAVFASYTESFMEVGQGLNWGCSTEGKKMLSIIPEKGVPYSESVDKMKFCTQRNCVLL
jgi:hypothetical protein